MNCNRTNIHRQKGVVTIPMLIGLMSLILISSIAIGSVSFNQTDMTRISNEGALALIYAEAGAKDAIQRITKDTNYPASPTPNPHEYKLPVADGASCGSSLSGCASVRVDSNNISPRIITVTGYSGSAERKIQVDVPYDENYKITNFIWNEVKSLPTASTGGATNITETEVDLNAWSNPNGISSTGYFRYSPTRPEDCSDNFGTRAPASGGDALSGSVPTAFSESLTGLTEGATYYYCAIVKVDSNNDKVYGQIFSFTMAGTFGGGSLGLPPTVSTQDTTDINDAFGSFRATLNGSANPNGFSSTGWFRYSTGNPVVCNDTFGTRVPGTGGTALGAGATSVPYSEEVTVNVNANETYFVCAIAENSAGKSTGLVNSFTTPGLFDYGLAIVSSIANPALQVYNYNSIESEFESAYTSTLGGNTSNSASFSNDDIYLAATHGSGAITVFKRSGDTFTELEDIDNISSFARNAVFSPDDKYLALGYKDDFLIYKNNRDDTFTKLTNAIALTEEPPGVVWDISFTSDATYMAVVNETTSPYLTIYKNNFDDTFTKIASPITDGDDEGSEPDYPNGTSNGVAFSPDGNYLAVGHTGGDKLTIYKNNGNDTFDKIYNVPTLDESSRAWDVAFSNDNEHLAVAHRNSPYLTIYKNNGNDTFDKLADPSTLPGGEGRGVDFSFDDEYLAVAHKDTTEDPTYLTIYKWNSVDSKFEKFGDPADLPLNTSQGVGFANLPATSDEPKTFTYAASDITLDAATLNGGAMPVGASTTGWFRYVQSDTDPGACDDSVWNRVPSTGGTSLGSGSSTVEYSETVNGLSAAKDYYFCAISQNSNGKTMGPVLSFTTLPLP